MVYYYQYIHSNFLNGGNDMSDFDLCKETLGGKRIIFLGSSVTYGACAMGQSFIEALEEKDGIIAIKEAVSGTLLI